MKNHFWQHIRIRVNSPGASIRFNLDSEKTYKRIKGIRVVYPQAVAEIGSTLGLTCNNKEVFKDDHEVRMLTCGPNVPPNKRFFEFMIHLGLWARELLFGFSSGYYGLRFASALRMRYELPLRIRQPFGRWKSIGLFLLAASWKKYFYWQDNIRLNFRALFSYQLRGRFRIHRATRTNYQHHEKRKTYTRGNCKNEGPDYYQSCWEGFARNTQVEAGTAG